MHFKHYISILLLSLFLFCDKEEPPFQSTGLIIGPDLGYCICCGGYVIVIADSSYHFDTLPNSATIDLVKDTFPIHVNLDWKYERKCEPFQYIEITRIEKQ